MEDEMFKPTVYVCDKLIKKEVIPLITTNIKLVTDISKCNYVYIMLGTMTQPVYEHSKGEFLEGYNAMKELRKAYASN